MQRFNGRTAAEWGRLAGESGLETQAGTGTTEALARSLRLDTLAIEGVSRICKGRGEDDRLYVLTAGDDGYCYWVELGELEASLLEDGRITHETQVDELPDWLAYLECLADGDAPCMD